MMLRNKSNPTQVRVQKSIPEPNPKFTAKLAPSRSRLAGPVTGK